MKGRVTPKSSAAEQRKRWEKYLKSEPGESKTPVEIVAGTAADLMKEIGNCWRAEQALLRDRNALRKENERLRKENEKLKRLDLGKRRTHPHAQVGVAAKATHN